MKIIDKIACPIDYCCELCTYYRSRICVKRHITIRSICKTIKHTFTEHKKADDKNMMLIVL